MRQPRLSYHVVPEVASPFDVPTKAVAPGGDLVSTLCEISPDKSAYWRSRDHSKLVVNALPRGPFGPSTEQISALLGRDLGTAINGVHDRFGVDIIALGFSSEHQTATANCRYTHRATALQRRLVVDVRELLLLHAAGVDGEFPDGVLVSCLSSDSHTHALWAPRAMPLSEALNGDVELAKRLGAPDSAVEFVHAVSGAPLRADQPCGIRTEFVCFADCHMRIEPKPSFLLPFSVFNHALTMEHCESSPARPVPCTNCLACTHICPAGLRPSFLYHNAVAGNLDECKTLGLEACIQCGWCSLTCPSSLPLHDQLMRALDQGDTEEDA